MSPARTRFWTHTASGLIAGLIAYMVSHGKPSVKKLLQLLFAHDLSMHLASLLDNRREGSRLAHDEFVAFLTSPPTETRPCVLASLALGLR